MMTFLNIYSWYVISSSFRPLTKYSFMSSFLSLCVAIIPSRTHSFLSPHASNHSYPLTQAIILIPSRTQSFLSPHASNHSYPLTHAFIRILQQRERLPGILEQSECSMSDVNFSGRHAASSSVSAVPRVLLDRQAVLPDIYARAHPGGANEHVGGIRGGKVHKTARQQHMIRAHSSRERMAALQVGALVASEML